MTNPEIKKQWSKERAIQFCSELDQARPHMFSSSTLESYEWKIEHLIAEAVSRRDAELLEKVEGLKRTEFQDHCKNKALMDICKDCRIDNVFNLGLHQVAKIIKGE